MRKYKGLIVSVSMAAMLMTSGTVFAEETETTEVTTEVASETEAASESASEEAAVESEVQAAEEVVEGGISASDRASLESYAQQSIEMIVGMDDAQAEEILHPSSILSKYQDSMVASVQSWVDAKEELGAYKQINAQDIEVDDDDIVISTACEFENGESVVTTTLSRDDLSLVSMEFATAEKTMGQKMEEAVLNTLMGVCVVFAMLFFLSFLIAQFKHISKLENGLKKKDAPAAAPAPAPVAAPAPVEEEVVDDGELIAVIAAAIAAAEGTSTDGFVVRSIKKSNRNKWQRA